jgi:hypothetical protein
MMKWNARNQSIRYLYFDGRSSVSWRRKLGHKYYELIDALTKWNLENPVKKACVLSFLSDVANILVGRKRKERYFLQRDEMHKTVKGQTFYLKDW